MNAPVYDRDDFTPFEREALLVLLERPGIALSTIGFALLERLPSEGYRKPNPSPQGVALFAGRFVRKLTTMQLVGVTRRGYALLANGERTARRLKGAA